jgi:hypothetical protein
MKIRLIKEKKVPPETLAVRLQRRPMPVLVFMMLSSFVLFVIGVLFVPKVAHLIMLIEKHGVAEMRFSDVGVMIFAALFGVLCFFYYLSFKVLEKAVIDYVLTSLPITKTEEQ